MLFRSKNEYGTYKQVLYVYNTLLIVFTLGVPKAFSFFLPRVGLVEGKSLINKIILLLFFLGIIFSACLFFLAEYLAGVLNNIQLTEPLKYFSLVPIFMLPIMGLDGILATYKRTLLLAIYNITTKVLMLLFVALPVVFFDGNCVDAIKGFTLSSFISMLIAFYLMNTPFHNIKSEKCEITYSEIFHFTLPLLYASFFGLLIQSADQFFISRYFGS